MVIGAVERTPLVRLADDNGPHAVFGVVTALVPVNDGDTGRTRFLPEVHRFHARRDDVVAALLDLTGGQRVMVTTSMDGAHYVAHAVKVLSVMPSEGRTVEGESRRRDLLGAVFGKVRESESARS